MASPPPSARPPVLSDEDAVEEPPPRREHKHTTANMQPERPWKRYIMICFVFLVVIAIMVVLSIFLKRLFDPDEDDDWDASNDTTTVLDDDSGGAVSALLPERLTFLNSVCAEDMLSGDARAKCEEVCAPAVDCCDPYKAGNSTCFTNELAGCVTYSQCHALDGIKDPAYNSIDRVCAMSAIEIDREECEFACSSLNCCFNDTDSCLGTSFQACLDYAPCQNLRRNPGIDDRYIEVAPFSLEADCRDGEPLCERECQEALCCSDPSSTCYRDNFIACLSYAWCTGNSGTSISVAPIYSRVSKAPDNLKDVCLSTYVDENGPSECQEVCADATCCFADGADGCFGDDPLGCLEYRSCSLIVQGPSS